MNSKNKPKLSPVIIVIGATGDLAQRKLLPALRALWSQGKLPPGTKFFPVGRKSAEQAGTWEIVEMLEPEYVQVNLEVSGGLNPLLQKLQELKDRQILLYLALAPEIVHLVLDRLGEPTALKLPRQTNISVIIEKPFGNDLDDAQHLNTRLSNIFTPQHVFRNDHYLNKDSVQAITRIREIDPRAQEWLSPENLAEAQLIISEADDLGARAGYFDGRGMLIDWLQSHMLQILSISFADLNSDNPSLTKADFISSLQPISESVVRGQYAGYLNIPGVNPELETETFLAVRFRSLLPKWQGVIFSTIAGKALDRKQVLLNLILKQPHPRLGSTITLYLDPPGGHEQLRPLSGDEFQESILNALKARSDKFVSQAEVEAQWQVVERIQELLPQTELRTYEKGINYQEFCTDEWCRVGF